MKQQLRNLLARTVNVLPVSSRVIGSPRKRVLAASLNRKGIRYIPVNDPVAITEPAPGTLDKDVFFKFPPLYKRVQPATFVLELDGGRVWGNKGAVITPADELVTDLSREFGKAKFDPTQHSVFSRLRLGKPEQLKGRWAVLASPGTDVYAHWFCDILPRFFLLRQKGLLEGLDGILLNYSQLDFQLDCLQRMGIPLSLIRNCKEDLGFHAVADTLVVPSYANEHGTVNAWVCEGVRELYTAERSQASNGPVPERIYISRGAAVGRQVIGEAAFEETLKRDFGFTSLKTEHLTMPEKAALFSQVKLIVAPHGGGLTNILFCTQGCKIVDLFPPGDFDTFFWSISNAIGLHYTYYFGKGERPTPENDFVRRNADIELDQDQLTALIRNLIQE